MILKSFGCSFIFGTDLHDDSRQMPKATPSQHTWPALLARQHGWDYVCYARPGSGNLQIAERLLSQLTDTEPAIYVVGWTWIDRFDYTTTDARHQWKTVMPIDTDSAAQTYYKHLHSEYRDKLTSLISVRLAIDELQRRGHRFIMTYMDDLMFDQRWNSTPAVTQLQAYCQPHMTQFDGHNLLQYAKQKGYEISETQHPLEAAHQAAFELIDSYNLL